jgi:hypothetical protein
MVSSLVTAAWSRRMPRVKECRQDRSSRSTASIHSGRPLAVAAGHHLRERGDVAGGGAQLAASGFDLAELGWLVIHLVTSRTAGGGAGGTGAVIAARSGCR